MGTETIHDPQLKITWENFINKAHLYFNQLNIQLFFSSFKNDGSNAKAKSGYHCINFVFAQDSSRSWVELEMKPRTIKGVKTPQAKLYKCLKDKYRDISSSEKFPITWNETDLENSPRRETGSDIRIKIYLKNASDDERIAAMAYLYNAFITNLKQCSQ